MNTKVGNEADRSIKWAQQKRLEFIDYRLFWEGRLNRADLTSYFGISVPQASLDLSLYADMGPQNLTYDPRLKSYVAATTFHPLFGTQTAEQYLTDLQARSSAFLWAGWNPPIGSAAVVMRPAAPAVVIALIKALREGEAVTCDVLSSSDLDCPGTQIISPSSFLHDGRQWRIRAYCFRTMQYRDFVLSRFQSITSQLPPPLAVPVDNEWATQIDVVIGVNPILDSAHKVLVEHDYEMSGGEATIRTSLALLDYLKQHLRSAICDTSLPPGTQEVLVLHHQIVTCE